MPASPKNVVKASDPNAVHDSEQAAARLRSAYGRLPLSFEQNTGQVDSRVKFLARGAGYTLFLTENETVLTLRNHAGVTDRTLSTGKAAAQTTATAASVAASVAAPKPLGLGAPMREPETYSVLRMGLLGANPHPKVTSAGKQPGIVNYLIGRDAAKWHTHVGLYGQVRYADVYPGVDQVYYGSQQKTEYDFVVAPNADPKQIKLLFRGADKLSVGTNGDLIVHLAGGGRIVQKAPVVYQGEWAASGWPKHRVTGEYVLAAKETLAKDSAAGADSAKEVSFRIGEYDHAKPLVIDPVLVYSTYLGGSYLDSAYGITVAATGEAYVTGSTSSTDFPTTPSAYQGSLKGATNVFVSKLSADGSTLLSSTYLGGSGTDEGYGIVLDSSSGASGGGSSGGGAISPSSVSGPNPSPPTTPTPPSTSSIGVYVAGYTSSANFPTTMGAYQRTLGGSGGSAQNGFIAKLSGDLSSLMYATYLGGSVEDGASSIALGASGVVYVAGYTKSPDFPATPGAFQTTRHCGASSPFGNAFAAKLSADGTSLLYATYLGGSNGDHARGIAVDSSGCAFVTGFSTSSDFPVTPNAYQHAIASPNYNPFVTKLSAGGDSLLYSTYLGGSGGDDSCAIAVDGAGNAYITGYTFSTNFPVTSNACQSTFHGSSSTSDNAFVSELSANGNSLLYSTYLGGSSRDFGAGIAVDGSGNIYVTGSVTSTDFPTTAGAYQTSLEGSSAAFISKISAGNGSSGGSLAYSTYLGGNDTSLTSDRGWAIAVDGSGSAYVVGCTTATDFPITVDPYQPALNGIAGDAFVSKLNLVGPNLTVNPIGRIYYSPDGSLTISGTGTPGTTITITVTLPNGQTITVTVTVGADGNWSYTFTGLPAGNYIVGISGQAPDGEIQTSTLNVCIALGVNNQLGGFDISTNNNVLSTSQSNAGSNVNTDIWVTPLGGFVGNVMLTVAGLPPGITASFSPLPVYLADTESVTSNLLLMVDNSVAAGSYDFTVNGLSGIVTGSSTASVRIQVTTPPTMVAQLAPYSLTLSSTAVNGGSNITGYVLIGGNAPSGGTTLNLTSSDGAVASVPTTVTIPAGSSGAAFSIATSTVMSPEPVTLSATGGGGTVSAVVEVNGGGSDGYTLTYSGGTFTWTDPPYGTYAGGPSHTSNYAIQPAFDYLLFLPAGYGASWFDDIVAHPVMCLGEITAHFHWTPRQIPDPENPGQMIDDPNDKPPTAVVLHESCTSQGQSSIGDFPQDEYEAGKYYADSGLPRASHSPLYLNPASKLVVTGDLTKGGRITVIRTFDRTPIYDIWVKCTPAAFAGPNSVPEFGNPTVGVSYSAYLTSNINFYHGTLFSIANALLTADLDSRGSADFGKGFYTVDEHGEWLASTLAIRAVKMMLDKGGTERDWGVVQFSIPAESYADFYELNKPSIVQYDDSSGRLDVAPKNAPEFTSTSPADQPNIDENPIPIGPMNWYNFAWNNWWQYRRSSDTTYIFGNIESDYTPVWLPQTPDDLSDFGRPIIRGKFFQPRKYVPGEPYRLGFEWLGAMGEWQWTWSGNGTPFLNAFKNMRSIVEMGTVP